MPRRTKAELQDTIDELAGLVDNGLDPQLSREDLVGIVKEMDGAISGEEEEEEDEEPEDETEED